MTLLNPLRGSDGELRRVRSISSGISKRLSALDSSDVDPLENLSREELQDLNCLVGVADLLLCKYADKKAAYAMFKEFASIVAKTADSLEQIDDEISELMLSADDSVDRISDMRDRISDRADFDPRYRDGPDHMMAGEEEEEEQGGIPCLDVPDEAAPAPDGAPGQVKQVELI